MKKFLSWHSWIITLRYIFEWLSAVVPINNYPAVCVEHRDVCKCIIHDTTLCMFKRSAQTLQERRKERISLLSFNYTHRQRDEGSKARNETYSCTLQHDFVRYHRMWCMISIFTREQTYQIFLKGSSRSHLPCPVWMWKRSLFSEWAGGALSRVGKPPQSQVRTTYQAFQNNCWACH